MQKNTLILIIVSAMSFGMPAFSQTLEKEYEYMMSQYLTKKLSQEEFRDISFAWRDLIDSVGYPIVPYDSVSRKVEYEFISLLDGIPREIIVNRVSEWSAVSFGSNNALLTHQGNASRLIINGTIEILFPDLFMVYKNAWRGYVETEAQNSSICYFTIVFTIREGKMKSQVLNLLYEYKDFVSGHSISRTLDSFFPVSSNEKEEWKDIISLINETSLNLADMIDMLTGYIRAYENDYNIN